MRGLEAEQRQRRADEVVEVPLGRERRPHGPADCGDHVLHGGLTDPARDRHDPGLPAAAVQRREVAERDERVVHLDDRDRPGRPASATDHEQRRAPLDRDGEEVVRVEGLAHERHEHASGDGRPRVREHAREDRGSARPGGDEGAARRPDHVLEGQGGAVLGDRASQRAPSAPLPGR